MCKRRSTAVSRPNVRELSDPGAALQSHTNTPESRLTLRQSSWKTTLLPSAVHPARRVATPISALNPRNGTIVNGTIV